MKTHILALISIAASLAAPLHAQTGWDPPETAEERDAKIILQGRMILAEANLNTYGDLMGRLWDGERWQVEARLAAMGTRAAGVFQGNGVYAAKIGEMLVELDAPAELVARFQAINAKVRPFTIGEDGSVTLQPEQ